MRRLPSLLMVLAALLVGCGDDDSTTPDAGNPSDQCVGASDQAILAPYLVDGGTGLSVEFNDLLRNCAQFSCSGELINGTTQEAEACMSACYASTGIADLSQGCQNCWTGSSICGAEFCAVPCIGTDPDLCAACVIENCNPARDYCTGL